MSPEDIALVRSRATAGDPDAVAFTAVLAGLGAGEPQSWTLALERLWRAEGLGSSSAAAQLAVIGGLEPWLQPAPRERLCASPRIARSLGFLSPAACDWLIGRARGRTRRAEIFDIRSGAPSAHGARTNGAFEFATADLDLVVLLVRAKIAATLATLPGALETIQMLHYAPGEQFDRHFDFLDPDSPGLAAEVALRGQRVATFLVYLNDGFEGGETDFPLAGLRYRGARGEALMFANVDAEGRPDRQSLHAGLAPASGEKWLLSQWVRDRAIA